MNENQFFLEKRIEELAKNCYHKNKLTGTGFLGLSEQSVFYEMLQGRRADPVTREILQSCGVLYGGFPRSERKVLFFMPDYMDREDLAQELTCLRLSPLNERFAESLSHRDILGALMNLGLERNRIGDILTDGQNAYVMVLRDISEFISRELTRIRHTCVSCTHALPSDCDIEPRRRTVCGSVASVRLDAVCAMVFKLSRGDARRLIEEERVFVSGRGRIGADLLLQEGMQVSVRGYGKFMYEGAGGMSRKGRLYVSVQKYE